MMCEFGVRFVFMCDWIVSFFLVVFFVSSFVVNIMEGLFVFV